MGAAYSTTNYRGPEYTEAERAELYRYNDGASSATWAAAQGTAVGGYFWAGIGATIAFFTVARLVADAIGWRRRRRAARTVWTRTSCDEPADPNLGKVTISHLPAFAVSLYRKATVDQPRCLEPLGMSIGQLLLLLGYLGLTFGLGAPIWLTISDRPVFGGSQYDIDWFAHHSPAPSVVTSLTLQAPCSASLSCLSSSVRRRSCLRVLTCQVSPVRTTSSASSRASRTSH